MSAVYRVSYETGNTYRASRHAEDYPTQSQAEQRVADLKATGITGGRVLWYTAEGDGARPCWCDEHSPIEERTA